MLTKKGAKMFADVLAKDLDKALKRMKNAGINIVPIKQFTVEDVKLIAEQLPEAFSKYLSPFQTDRCLSKIQKKALLSPCPLCQGKLTVVGDLADFKHDIVTCENESCPYTLMFDGSTCD